MRFSAHLNIIAINYSIPEHIAMETLKSTIQTIRIMVYKYMQTKSSKASMLILVDERLSTIGQHTHTSHLLQYKIVNIFGVISGGRHDYEHSFHQ